MPAKSSQPEKSRPVLTFDQAMRRLVQVPKEELDAELAKHARMRKRLKTKK